MTCQTLSIVWVIFDIHDALEVVSTPMSSLGVVVSIHKIQGLVQTVTINKKDLNKYVNQSPQESNTGAKFPNAISIKCTSDNGQRRI
jgi:hypothetical protein